jgi:hypothetical protein
VVSELEAFLVRHVEAGTVPGGVALRGGRDPEVVAAGVDAIGGDPVREDAIFRIHRQHALDALQARLIGSQRRSPPAGRGINPVRANVLYVG